PARRALVERAREITFAQARAVASQWRPALGQALIDVLTRYDFMVCPTMPLTAFPHPGDAGGNTQVDGVPVRIPSLDFHRLTEPFSHAGLPALTVPCGFDGDGLPAGLQIVGGVLDGAGGVEGGAGCGAGAALAQRRAR